MTILALGINHKTAPVALREKVAFTPDALVAALGALRQQLGVNAGVIVSTCNRTELYLQDERDNKEIVLKWLADFHGVSTDLLQQHMYTHTGQEAVRHIMRVASGLDSLVLGEPQVLGQVKQAFNDARHCGVIDNEFERLFQFVFNVAKRVRSETDIGANAVSVAYAAVQLAKHVFSGLPKRSVLLVGAGETIELVAQHLKEQGVTKMHVANRTIERATALAQRLGASVMTLSQLPGHLHEFDIVISSTASQLPLIGKGMVEQALRQRRNLPMFLVDLAVPRDIEEQVNELGDAYLYTVDDLQHIVEQNMASRQQAAQAAEKMIAEQALQYASWRQSQQSIDLLRQYRQNSQEVCQTLLRRAQQQIQEGKSADEAMAELAHKLSQQLMHGPTRLLREAASKDDANMTQWLAEAFSLTQTPSQHNTESDKTL